MIEADGKLSCSLRCVSQESQRTNSVIVVLWPPCLVVPNTKQLPRETEKRKLHSSANPGTSIRPRRRAPVALLSHMDSALHEVWQAASGRPFVPTIGKDSHFLVGFSLLVLGLGLSGAFFLSMFFQRLRTDEPLLMPLLDRSFTTLPVIGLPASLALA